MRSAEPSSPGGCGEGEEDDLGVADAFFEVGGEFQSFFFEVAEEEFFETGFIDGDLTVESFSTFLMSMSTQQTSLPVSAKQVPVTRPTYPVPITAIFIKMFL